MPIVESVADDDWPRGDYLPLASIPIPLPEICEQRGLESIEFEEPGLGPGHGIGLRIESDLFFYLEDYEWSPGGRQTTINVLDEKRTEAVLTFILAGMGLDRSDVDWITELI